MASKKVKDRQVMQLSSPDEAKPSDLRGSERMLTPEIQAEFKALMVQDPTGLLKPEVIVARAENPLSPLHKYFTWDDEKAAEQWRMVQARFLIRSFRVELEPLTIVPAFVSLKSDRLNGGGYTWAGEVLPKVDFKRNLLYTVFSDMEGLLRKVENFPEVEELRKAIEKAKNRVSLPE